MKRKGVRATYGRFTHRDEDACHAPSSCSPIGGESGREPVGPSPEIFMGVGVWVLDLLNSVFLFN